jgi:hypothetical protein
MKREQSFLVSSLRNKSFYQLDRCISMHELQFWEALSTLELQREGVHILN